MQTRVLELKEPITKFLKFYKSPRGKKEFRGAKTKLAEVEEKDWALISGICYLLGSFDSATKLLSGEKYSSFVCAFPVLRSIREKIGNDSLFAFPEGDDFQSSKFKRNFYGQYGNEPFFGEVILVLNRCGRLLLKNFMDQFSCMDADIVWTTLLDPRFSLKSCHWRDEDKKSTVKNFLMENVKQVALDESYALSSSSGNEDTTRMDDGLEDENAICMFESDATNHYNHQSTILTREKAKVHAN